MHTYLNPQPYLYTCMHAYIHAANIRNPDFRTLCGLRICESSAALETIAHELGKTSNIYIIFHSLRVTDAHKFGRTFYYIYIYIDIYIYIYRVGGSAEGGAAGTPAMLM